MVKGALPFLIPTKGQRPLEPTNKAFQKPLVFVADLVFRQARHEILALRLSQGELRRIRSEIANWVFTPDLECLPG